jgi:hypothetical protein
MPELDQEEPVFPRGVPRPAGEADDRAIFRLYHREVHDESGPEAAMIPDILSRVFYQNRVSEYLLCLAILAGGIVAVKILQSLLSRRLKARAVKTLYLTRG